jgi:hypothetical protein
LFGIFGLKTRFHRAGSPIVTEKFRIRPGTLKAASAMPARVANVARVAFACVLSARRACARLALARRVSGGLRSRAPCAASCTEHAMPLCHPPRAFALAFGASAPRFGRIANNYQSLLAAKAETLTASVSALDF